MAHKMVWLDDKRARCAGLDSERGFSRLPGKIGAITYQLQVLRRARAF